MAGINVLKSTAVVGAFTMLSRFLGLVREMLQAHFIGAGVEQSAFALAFAIPNMARKLFGEGALTAAFVPVFKGEVESESMEKAAKLARAVMTMVLLMLGATVILCLCGLEVVVHYRDALGLTSGESAKRFLLTIRLVKTLLPYMIFICGAAFGMGVLNALGKFKAASFMPCLLNVFWIGILAWFAFNPDLRLDQRIHRVAMAILVAGAVQMAYMMWRMKKAGVSPLPRFSGWRDSKVRLVWRNTAIAAIGAGAVQINYMLDTALAQIASKWAAGVIGYAERLMDLPLGVIGAAFGTVLLPAFAEKFSRNDGEGAREVFVSSSRNMLFVMIPAAVGLGLLAPEVVSVIYKGGEFDAMATVRVSRAVCCYAFGLAFFGLQKSLVPWFQAQNDMKTPLKVSVAMVVLNACLNILAVFGLPEEWRHVGLAGSTVLCAGLSCVILSVLAHRRNGEMGYRRLVKPVAKMAIASAFMAVVIIVVRALWMRFLAPHLPDCFAIRAVMLGLVIGSGMTVYFAAAIALMPEMRDFVLRKLRLKRR